MIALSGISNFCFSQTSERRVIEGVLRDESGYTLPGVNIVIKGTQIGTVSDIDGAYRIEANLRDILVFSSVGYGSYEVEVTKRNSKPLHGKDETPQISKLQYKPKMKSGQTEEEGRNIAYLTEKTSTFKIKYKNYYQIKGLPSDSGTTEYTILPQAIQSIRYFRPKKAKNKYDLDTKTGIIEIDERLNRRLSTKLCKRGFVTSFY
jgi:hypothetical protein